MRVSTRYVSYDDRKTVCARLKEIYRAPSEQAELEAIERLEERWGESHGWKAALSQFAASFPGRLDII